VKTALPLPKTNSLRREIMSLPLFSWPPRPFRRAPNGPESPEMPESMMESPNGEKLALQSVRVEGRLDGLLLSTVIRQHYRNDTAKNLEIVYTFPLGYGNSLLGLTVEMAGKRLQGVVIEKKEAEERYEKALEEGDTPIMVQESSPGLYTANLGNIKAHETISVEIRCAQLLRFEQDQIRVKIPTVIAPRYGDPHKDGGLAPHETDRVDLAAKYAFSVRLDIMGETAKAKITSPSHPDTVITATENGASVLLEAGAMLDRDFILILQGLAGHSFALSVPDEERHTVLASFCPKLPVKADPVLLKILVDCSGSMEGDSIRQAQRGLQTIIRELSGHDYISFSRFGSKVEHNFSPMKQCASGALQKLSSMVKGLSADLGGTEMEQAVLSTCQEVAWPKETSLRPSILLITDDLYWSDGSLLRKAIKSGHRFFTIGVGSAPAESLLRQLAEKTGGACEFVTPNEDMTAAIVRMFRRMRVAQTNKLRIDWGSEALWQSPLPLSIFDGETLHLFASFAELPTQKPALLWEADGKTESASPETVTATENRDLARLGAAERLPDVSKQEALDLALKYQLVSEQSSLFLAYLREGEDKVTELPQIHQVPQMMAAGSHGYGSVLMSCAVSFFVSGAWPSKMFQSSQSFTSSPTLQSNPPAAAQTPRELLEQFDRQALAHQDYARVLGLIRQFTGDVQDLITDFANQEGITPEQAWAVFLDWLVARLANDYTLSRQGHRLLRSQTKTLDQARSAALQSSLDQRFSAVSAVAWH